MINLCYDSKIFVRSNDDKCVWYLHTSEIYQHLSAYKNSQLSLKIHHLHTSKKGLVKDLSWRLDSGAFWTKIPESRLLDEPFKSLYPPLSFSREESLFSSHNFYNLINDITAGFPIWTQRSKPLWWRQYFLNVNWPGWGVSPFSWEYFLLEKPSPGVQSRVLAGN